MLKHIVSRLNNETDRAILTKIREFRLHSSVQQDWISHFFASLDSPLALSCDILYRSGEYEQLVKKEINPGDYNCPEKFRRDFAAVSLLRKTTGLKTGIDTKSVSLINFEAGELKCQQTNLSLPLFLRSVDKNRLNELQVYFKLVAKIGRWLGKFDIDEVLDSCSWGPGVTTLIKGSDTSSSKKFDIERFITQDAYDLYKDVLIAAYPLWDNLHEMQLCPGNTVVTVPKSAKTDRTIAIEPGLNLWIQLGIGKSLRRRLRFASYDLNSDYKNRNGALKGSQNGTLATVDFSSASDTISCSLVELLLPRDWYIALDSARSKRYSFDKKHYHWSNKFSTMGNGFTFELESLIFVALAEVVCESLGLPTRDISVFGDDIIIPVEAVALYTQMCELLGFTINQKKSFSDGYFRESCGSYFFNGVDVKPFFNKKSPTTLKDVYRLLNSVTHLSHTFALRVGRDRCFKTLWHHLLGQLPSNITFFGPVSAGDAVIHRNLLETKVKRAKNGWEGFTFTAIPTVSVSVEKDSLGLHLARLHGASKEQSYGNKVPLRAKVRILLKKRMFTSQWYNLGDWI